MLSVEEALERVVAEAGSQPVVGINLEDALELYLAEGVSADMDSPPFDKSMMDGYAIRTIDAPGGKAALERIGRVDAGQVSTLALRPGAAIEIMTGAPIPAGADAVVMVERTRLNGAIVSIDDAKLHAGQNILPRAREYARGQEVLSPGHRLGPAQIGLLAAVGRLRPRVFRRPNIAILSTGDEIVEPSEKPGPSQIRNSNASTLAAMAMRAGARVDRLGIAGDNEKVLRTKVEKGFDADILLLSGGVSAGQKDFVPRVLDDLAVRKIFHGVAFKPGKPLWFGRRLDTLVFGLPGNPVSALACFEVFVRTALRARQHAADPLPTMIRLPLASDFPYSTRRPTYHPAKVRSTAEGLSIEPLNWAGSPDLLALTKADALVVLPVGERFYHAGEQLSVLWIANGRDG